jgi:hypothetical protein
MTRKNGSRVAWWVKNHKFWTSAIVLCIVESLMVSFIHSPGLAKFLGNLMGAYLLFGGLIWSIRAKKKGLTLMTLGALFLASSLPVLLIMLLMRDGYGIALTGWMTLVSGLMLYFGIRRYLRQKRERVGE